MQGLFKQCLVFIAISATSISFAATTIDNVDQAPNNMVPTSQGKSSCKNLVKSCKAAGFSKHGASGKGLFKDCVIPLVKGNTVTGVNAEPNDIQSCQAHRASKHMDDSQSTPSNTTGGTPDLGTSTSSPSNS